MNATRTAFELWVKQATINMSTFQHDDLGRDWTDEANYYDHIVQREWEIWQTAWTRAVDVFIEEQHGVSTPAYFDRYLTQLRMRSQMKPLVTEKASVAVR